MEISLQNHVLPEDIEARSFEIIEDELGPKLPFAGAEWEVARRMVHTSADYSILKDITFTENAVESGIAALLSGCRIFTDTEMARVGMPVRRLNPLRVQVECVLSLPGVAELAENKGQTRAKSGIEVASHSLGGSIIAVGNAPTALLSLLDYLEAGNTPPALVLAMPVGFVNASESKELFLRYALKKSLPGIVLRGRRGGSPLVAAVINALAIMASRCKTVSVS